MQFTRNTHVPSAVRPVTGRKVQVEVWQRTPQGRVMQGRYTLTCQSRADAVTKQANALGLSRSQWNGKNPEYVLRAY